MGETSKNRTFTPPIPIAPPGLGIELRPQDSDDEPFLRQLYHHSRDAELTRAGLNPAMMHDFLDSQFQLQSRHYHAHFGAGGAFLVIMRQGEPIGRLYIHWRDGDLRLVDITLLPPWRGQGIGSALLAAIKELARQGGARVSLHVAPFNPALALYLRQGFITTDTTGASWRLEWRPDGSASTAGQEVRT